MASLCLLFLQAQHTPDKHTESENLHDFASFSKTSLISTTPLVLGIAAPSGVSSSMLTWSPLVLFDVFCFPVDEFGSFVVKSVVWLVDVDVFDVSCTTSCR